MTDFTKEFIAEARESITEPGVERYICIPVQLEMLDEIERLQSRIAELEALVNVSEGLYERIYEQAARIAELEAESDQLTAHSDIERQDDKWIPVSERLPEDTERMLTIVYDAFEDTTAISILQHYGDGDWFSWDSGRYVVTHWMPLPESPNDTQTQTIVYGKESEE